MRKTCKGGFNVNQSYSQHVASNKSFLTSFKSKVKRSDVVNYVLLIRNVYYSQVLGLVLGKSLCSLVKYQLCNKSLYVFGLL